MPDRKSRLREVALLFTRLGFTAFGGPAAHLALIEDEVVQKRKWIDRQHFLDMVAAVNFVPGPNSTELAIHLGAIRAGFAGLVVAGVCFITPAMLIILPIAYFYVKSGTLPQVSAAMGGINAAVIGVIVAAMIRFARAAVIDPFTALIAIASAAAGFVCAFRFPQFQPELVILATAALLGMLYYARPKISAESLAGALLPMLGSDYWHDIGRLCLFLLKVAATLFGSGYVLISYLQSGLVDHYHWFTRQQVLDAISVGQVTPGPLLTTATFVGYVLGAQKFGGGVMGGIIGGILATIAIFLPSFIFIALLGGMLQRIRQNRFARGALTAMNAAVVALLLVVCWKLGTAALMPGGRLDVIYVVVAVVSLAVLLKFNLNATWLVVGGAIVGLLRTL